MTLKIEEIELSLNKSSEKPVGFTTKIHGSYSDTSSNINSATILYNQGSAYNGTMFTCPIPGLYLFQVSVIQYSDRNGIWIYRNSQILTLAYSAIASAGNLDSASVSVVTWLDKGDHVFLRPYSTDLRLDGNSAFTGVKIN